MKYRVPMSSLLLAGLLLSPSFASAASACTDGDAGGNACSHVDLLSQLSIQDLGGATNESANDIWGWTDPLSGDEYAIIGMFNGTAFVRLGDGTAPEFLGRLPDSDGEAPITKQQQEPKSCGDDCEGASSWRDIKVYGNHAFIVSEGGRHGMQVFDLTRLRGISVPPASDWDMDGHYDGIGHAHNIVINEDRGRAYIVGGGSRTAGEGGLHIIDISTPTSPVFLADVNDDAYTHDAQCVNYAGPSVSITAGDDICFAANEDTLTIWNVTDPVNPELLSKTSYSGVRYTHQLWLTEDQRYLYLNDELDEQLIGTRTNTRILDVSDPENPVFVDEYLASTLAIDHNNYVKDGFLYQSNYLAGLRILDIGDPVRPVEAAYFDVSPIDAASFAGTWSNYPYFDSGLVVVSDIGRGLFVLRPTLDGSSSQADLSVAMTAETGASDEAIPYRFDIDNAGGIDLDDVLVTVHLPPGPTLEVVSVTPEAGWSCPASGRVIECRAASMVFGESLELVLNIVPDGTFDGELIVSAYARQVDATPGNNRSSENVSGGTSSEAPAGSGGGGGAPAWLLLFLMAALLPRKDR